MKKVYLYMFVAVLAIVMIIASLVSFNPEAETWASLIAGAAIALFIVKLPAIIAYFKNKRQNGSK